MNTTDNKCDINEKPIIDRRPHSNLTPQQPGTDKSCGLRMLTLTEVLRNLLKDAQQAHNILVNTDSPEDIRIVLERIQNYQVDSRVPQNIKSIIADIRGSVHAMRLHDFTRSQMCEMLHKLLTVLEGAIAQEEHNERVKRVHAFLMVLDEHVEELTIWVEKSGVFPF